MDYATTLNIDQQGRIIIPAKVRKALQLHTQNVEKAVTASGVVTAPPKWLQHFYAIAWTISDITEKIPAPLPS